MRYGFVIDQNRCIGCHACTVACKEEHNVPIGVNRTWVKYIEKGQFPDTRRHFAVLRCNHCDDAPCIEICPTVALFRRPDGIVDFDGDRCIGCKSCMQACPYDALYIDPNTKTAAKCNFCAHRLEVGLRPSCEIICPTQAIVSGDLDDSTSDIAKIVASQKVTLRKPGKGTHPKLFYVGVDGDLLEPTMMEPQSMHLWADKHQGEDLYALTTTGGRKDNTSALLDRLREENRVPSNPGLAREVYDVPHPTPWGRMIAAYLWTKGIAAGSLLVAATLLAAGYKGDPLLSLVSPVLALLFTGLTVSLLVFDLKRPERFFYLLTKPNPRSWLVIGGYVLFVYGIFASLWLFFGLTGRAVPHVVLWLTALFAICAACYTAFLFAQAKGRDLWQSPLFFWHLLVQAVTAGAAALIGLGVLLQSDSTVMGALTKLLGGSLVLSAAMILAEVSLTHVSEDSKRAVDLLKKGSLSGTFWWLVIAMGTLLPLLLLISLTIPIPAGAREAAATVLSVSASILALVGLWFFDNLWIKAGQAAPLS